LQCLRTVDQRFELRLAFARDRDAGPQLRADGVEELLDIGIARIQLGGGLQLDERLVQLPGGFIPASARQVILGGPHLRSLESLSCRVAVGIPLKSFGVFNDRPIEVAGEFGLFAGVNRPRRGAAGKRDRKENDKHESFHVVLRRSCANP
jgi:hypothetical protein